jgi:hypothetical protein
VYVLSVNCKHLCSLTMCILLLSCVPGSGRMSQDYMQLAIENNSKGELYKALTNAIQSYQYDNSNEEARQFIKENLATAISQAMVTLKAELEAGELQFYLDKVNVLSQYQEYLKEARFIHSNVVDITDLKIKYESKLLDEENRRKAEEERLKAELMKSLKAKREQFLHYGFDVLDFVNYAKATLRIKGEINFGGAIPEIDFRTFKNKNYVEIKVNYLVTYNILKVSMYDAASMTFDEIVKKLATKITTDFKKQDDIAGFIFKVTYTNKDFSEKYDAPRYVTNEFILPKEACKQYAALDITNQDLINQSIVLVDGERISLNLQISR